MASWFTSEKAKEDKMNMYTADENHPVLMDKIFIKKIKTEIKHFEICLRLFEQTCIATIIET